MPQQSGRHVRTPVLIAGAGPVGLCLALDLAHHGVSSVVIERTDGGIRHPKAGSLSSRTMEFCRRWNIAEQIRHCGFPRDYGLSMVFSTSMAGHTLGTHHYPSMDDDHAPRQSPEKKQRSPQLFFDPIIAAAAQATGKVTFFYETELVSFASDGSGVEAEAKLRLGAEPLRIKADYLVGCDGAGSAVRERLGIGLKGNKALDYSVAIFLRIAGLARRHDKGDAERYIFLGPEGTWGNLTAVDGRELWRLTVLGAKAHIDMNRFDADFWVRRSLGDIDIDYSILDVMPWRRSSLVAESYGGGRVFIAGDAAHTMSPTGGFGFNTGAGDAVDLSWKLAAAIQGWGGSGLLESYGIERQPIGARNVAFATSNYFHLVSAPNCEDILQDSATGEAVRERIGRGIKAATMTEWETVGVNLGYRYENSPICIADGTPAPPDSPSDYVQTSRPGHRAPHAWRADGSSMIDLFGKGFVLLRFAGSDEPASLLAAARQRGVPLTSVLIDEPDIGRLYEARYVLVRPDGHTAWRGDRLPADAMRVIDTVRGEQKATNRGIGTAQAMTGR